MCEQALCEERSALGERGDLACPGRRWAGSSAAPLGCGRACRGTRCSAALSGGGVGEARAGWFPDGLGAQTEALRYRGVAGAAGAAAAASAAAAESAQAAGVDCPWAARESSPSRAPPGQGALSSSGSSARGPAAPGRELHALAGETGAEARAPFWPLARAVTSGSTARGGGPLGSDVSTDDGEQARPRLSEGAKRHLGKDGQASRTLAGAGQGTPGTPSRY
ncbi:unnamed protein product, partial [Prorocentrum cordatum]